MAAENTHFQQLILTFLPREISFFILTARENKYISKHLNSILNDLTWSKRWNSGFIWTDIHVCKPVLPHNPCQLSRQAQSIAMCEWLGQLKADQKKKKRTLLVLQPWITVIKCGGNKDTVFLKSVTWRRYSAAREREQKSPFDLLGCASCLPFLVIAWRSVVAAWRFTRTVALHLLCGAAVTSHDPLIPIKAQRNAEVTKASCEVSHCDYPPPPSAAPPRMSPALVQHFLWFYSQHFLSSSTDQQED